MWNSGKHTVFQDDCYWTVLAQQESGYTSTTIYWGRRLPDMMELEFYYSVDTTTTCM
jgi:hypothetical protein